MWALLIVDPPILLAEHLGLQQRGEELEVEKFVSQAAVETIDEAVLPRSPRLDIARLDGLRDKLRPLV